MEYTTYLDFPKPVLRAYPRETVVAEKYQAMVMLGIANSRMKDFYDVWMLARQFAFAGPTLCQAIQATFDRRRTDFPTSAPLALTAEFYEDPSKLMQWRAFVSKSRLDVDESGLEEVMIILKEFLLPPTEAVAATRSFDMVWRPGGPWGVGVE